jgi:hypothetical protein
VLSPVYSICPCEVIFLAALVSLTLEPLDANRLLLRRRAISTGGVKCC